MVLLGLAVLILGIIILMFGTRIILLSAGVGALLGIGILRFLPFAQDSYLWLIIPLALALVFALAGDLMKEMVNVVTLAVGAFAGGSLTFALLDLMGASSGGALDWVLALGGAIVGAAIVRFFKDWAIILLIALIGAFLSVRGLDILLPVIHGPVATLLALVVTAAGVAYHGGFIGKHTRTVPR